MSGIAIPQNMYYYAFTIRRLAGTQLEKINGPYEHVERLREKYPHLRIEYHYEIVDKLNGNDNIHVHGMIQTPKKVLYKLLHPGDNYHFWIEPVKTVAAWNVYMTKSRMTNPEHVWHNIRWETRETTMDDEEEIEDASQEDDGVSSLIEKLGRII